MRSHIRAIVRQDVLMIPVEDIHYFMAQDRYILVSCAQRDCLINETLKSLESEFDTKFLRVHRNALVRKDLIQGTRKTPAETNKLKVNVGGVWLEVSRRYESAVRKHVKDATTPPAV